MWSSRYSFNGRGLAIPVFDDRVVVDQAALTTPHRGYGETPFPAPVHQESAILVTERAEDGLHVIS